MTNYNVRPITSSDYKAVNKIDILTQIQYLGQEKWNNLTPKEKESHLESRQPNYDGFVKSGYSLLVESEGVVLGFILAFETVPVYQEVYCEYVAIDPQSQGKGIVALLYKELIQIAKKNNIKKVWDLINLDNPNSLKAHLKSGFKMNDRKEAVLIIHTLP